MKKYLVVLTIILILSGCTNGKSIKDEVNQLQEINNKQKDIITNLEKEAKDLNDKITNLQKTLDDTNNEKINGATGKDILKNCEIKLIINIKDKLNVTSTIGEKYVAGMEFQGVSPYLIKVNEEQYNLIKEGNSYLFELKSKMNIPNYYSEIDINNMVRQIVQDYQTNVIKISEVKSNGLENEGTSMTCK